MKIKNANVLKNNKKNLYEYSRMESIYSIIYYKILKNLEITKNV